jgi:hypothetical protein
MARSINSIIEDADKIINSKVASGPALPQDDDIFKLASNLTKGTSAGLSEDDFTLTEKIAHAIAVVDTILNIPAMAKIANFTKVAQDQGYTEGQISEFFEKNSSVEFRSVFDLLTKGVE